MGHEDQIHYVLTSVFQLATAEALASTIEAVAAELGVATIQGIPVREYFERKKLERAEHLVAAWADDNPAQASKMKQAWDELRQEPS